MGHGNYPDDIHNYDNHPQSPFYVEPWLECQECENHFDVHDMASEHLCNECDAEMRAYDSASLEKEEMQSV